MKLSLVFWKQTFKSDCESNSNLLSQQTKLKKQLALKSELFVLTESWRVWLILCVQAAFCFTGPAPSPGPLVLAEAGRTRAGCRTATDADISRIVQRVVWDLALGDAIPDMFLCPVRKRVHFYQVKFFVPADDRCCGTIWTLVSANGRCPGMHATRCPF